MIPPRFVALFDLDGTLVASAGGSPSAGLLAMNLAAERLTGRRGLGDPAEFAGRTDLQIARMLLAAGGADGGDATAVAELIRIYVSELERAIPSRPYVALGDPAGAVRALAAIGGIVGLGTGNVPRGAALKLESAGIAGLFDMARGGYGDDGDERHEVLATGARRCDPTGALPVVIIGDTPRDVAAARAIGAACVGIPFLENTAEVLRSAGAEAILPAVGPELAKIVPAFIEP